MHAYTVTLNQGSNVVRTIVEHARTADEAARVAQRRLPGWTALLVLEFNNPTTG